MMPVSVCARCGHTWLRHASYDDALERYITHACEHWDQCDCPGFVDEEP